tara:strand:+ start:185 stop:1393 length:1209 start_codon:yes stop_codon:yes gene_type:complete
MTLKMLDTFAGIGGFSYAAKYLIDPGIETAGFVEIDPFCQKILSKNFPNIPIYDDITSFTAKPFQYDIISGGFPCQDISVAGRQKGITQTTRSGLFYELIRVIRMVRPKYVILENVSAILNNGMGTVLAELYETGLYECEWATFPASLIGAAHQRDRWWLVAYPIGIRSRSKSTIPTRGNSSSSSNRSRDVADSNSNGSSTPKKSRSTQETNGRSEERKDIIIESEGGGKSRDSGNFQLSITDTKSSTWNEHEVEREHGEVKTQEISRDRDSSGDTRKSSNSISKGVEKRISELDKELQETRSARSSDSSSDRGSTSNSNSIGTQSKDERYNPSWKVPVGNGETRQTLSPKWRGYVSQPCLRRGDDGLRGRMDRLKALGNSVVPQCAAIPLQRVIQLEREQQ